MNPYKIENAVAAIRVSSTKQGLQGDSPQAQKEQIEQFAKAHNINVKKFFIFMESASKEEQPVQEAIDYCKNPKNDIQLFIIKSIDRFTRGGSYFYDHMKMQLTHYGVRLIDIYGIIGNTEVNTLGHLGIEFPWSVYSPTKKSEILEAERAKDEIRDILSRMIGAEIRYVRMGYRVRPSPYGYMNVKIDTPNGKRVILKPHPKEAPLIIKMFELRAKKTISDEQIIEEVNKMGYKSRVNLLRDPKDKTVVIGERGGIKLAVKRFVEYIRKPIYAGINDEKWTNDQPVKTKFDGLISIELFNKANRGKVVLTEENGGITIYKNKPEEWRLKKCVKNPDYPYKRYVLCPTCRYPLYGSASRGRNGTRYPAYHCNKRNHYFRIPAETFEQTIKNFVSRVKVTQEGVEKLKQRVLSKWQDNLTIGQRDVQTIDEKIAELESQKKLIGKQMMKFSSDEAIKLAEDNLKEVVQEIAVLNENKNKQEDKNIDMTIVLAVVGEFLETLV
ncbi:MAG: recombinase family protein [Candidatus Levyibacteriota bacterium]|nr:MAG: recombinase family protein [Candidatus Levybacteria bacterium]